MKALPATRRKGCTTGAPASTRHVDPAAVGRKPRPSPSPQRLPRKAPVIAPATSKPKRTFLPGWSLIACGCLFLLLCVVAVLAGAALLTSRQVVVGELKSRLASQQALRNDLSTELGLLGQPDHLLSRALAAGVPASPTANSTAHSAVRGAAANSPTHISAHAGQSAMAAPQKFPRSSSGRMVQEGTRQAAPAKEGTPQQDVPAGSATQGSTNSVSTPSSGLPSRPAGHGGATQGRSTRG
ncbi:MAG: hypothetical protein M1399_02960 [Actinobacteria bacterium]|nr:hypothetical protein [Actinomycetota bacterium]MCL5446369.1 hypothetical protein [Actinomycetota bacterium]